MKSGLWLMVGMTAVLSAGCAVAEVDDNGDEIADLDSALLSANSLAWANLSTHLADVRVVFDQGLRTSPSLTRLSDTPEGRQVLKYIVECALLPGDTAAYKNSSGEIWKFKGKIGLAPAAKTATTTVAERGWLSACLGAHVNADGLEIDISLLANHARLQTPSLLETKEFTFREAVFAGGIGWYDGVNGLHLFGFTDADLELECGDWDASSLAHRRCGTVDCGTTFIAAGAARDHCTRTNGVYTSCTVGSLVLSQVINVRLLADTPIQCVPPPKGKD